jgi:hypothetical protein
MMSEVVISNDVDDYQECVGEILRDRSGFPIGTIAEVTTYVMNGYGERKAVFILEDGRKVYVELTKFRKRKFIPSAKMEESHKVSVSLMNQISYQPDTDNFAIGRAFYRSGRYCGTIVSKGADDFGSYVVTNTGVKIRTAGVESDEFFSA